MRRLVLDPRGIPTGEEEAFDSFDAQLGDNSFDDCFALFGGSQSLSLAGAGRRITVEFLSGYRYAQVFAPKGKDYVALEPMTAPTNALTSGRGLHLVEPGREFRSAFRIRLEGALVACNREIASPVTAVLVAALSSRDDSSREGAGHGGRPYRTGSYP